MAAYGVAGLVDPALACGVAEHAVAALAPVRPAVRFAKGVQLGNRDPDVLVVGGEGVLAEAGQGCAEIQAWRAHVEGRESIGFVELNGPAGIDVNDQENLRWPP